MPGARDTPTRQAAGHLQRSFKSSCAGPCSKSRCETMYCLITSLVIRSPTVRAKYPSSHISPDHRLFFIWRKRQHDMNMFFFNFKLNHLKSIFFADLLNQLLRSFPHFFPLKYFLPVFRTPYQMIAGIVDRMTRSFYRHTLFISHFHARAYLDKGDFPVPLITPSERHAFIPRGKPRGILQRFL